MLLVDLRVSTRELETVAPFESTFGVQRSTAMATIDKQIEALAPSVICFDFDFPTLSGLKTLQNTKKAHQSVPVLMMTVQHSEELAVWAFRARVWDYLVKPVPRRDIERCIDSLTEMLAFRTAQNTGRMAALPRALIPEENRIEARSARSDLSLGPAIEYVERGFRQRLSSAEAAQRCRVTTFQLSRLFRESFGMTFQEYVQRFRIREACRLLQAGAVEIGDVAMLTGFNDPSYFGKVFRRYLHCSPSEFVSSEESSLYTEALAASLR